MLLEIGEGSMYLHIGKCPACAERETIVSRLEKLIAVLYRSGMTTTNTETKSVKTDLPINKVPPTLAELRAKASAKTNTADHVKKYWEQRNIDFDKRYPKAQEESLGKPEST